MAFGAVPKDSGTIPIASVYVPGVGFIALSGSTTTNTDGSSNVSTPANLNLQQIGSIATQMAGSDSITPANVLFIANGLYNGASIDQQRGNMNLGALITASGVTTGQTGGDITNHNCRGVVCVLDMTSAGTGSVTLNIQGKDTASGKYYTIASSAAVTTNSTNALTVYPGIGATANVNINNILPRIWRVTTTANNANATTYTVGACIIV